MYWIEIGRPGKLAIMPQPWGGPELEGQISAWKSAGVDVVVSTLRAGEEMALGLIDEAEICRTQDIDFMRLPMVDGGLPDEESACRRVCEDVAGRVTSGRNVVIHCRAGIGRSGMLCAATLVVLGFSVDEALARVERARGMPVPESEEQRQWVYRFASESY